ncbi:Ent-kaurene oxidase [Colletotrichum gloeosporioides]|uniref:Ent-kaurene oxidase n=1 Tax=Colletotrichum gloeosporioides TaxID=474922 RepID=A0A8H4CN50_COLGL|nr:Ent-kaurene oxidase [Colletotrichum gloeosporioides]KAF3807008.1 Ent-kaurene oxidase [Colletotrichum gloeosporioides]
MNVTVEDTSLLPTLVARWPLVFTALVTLIPVIAAKWGFKKDRLGHIPSVGAGRTKEQRRQEFMAPGGARRLYREGYEKFKGRAFQIMTASELPTVVIPPKFIPELKKLSDSVLGFQEATDEAINNQYLDIPTDTMMLAHTVKVSLTPALARLSTAIADEVTHAIDTELPSCKDWTEVPINNKLFRIVAMASGRVFVGPELCRNEAYLDTAINYTVDMVNAVLGVMGLPAWRRRFSSRRLPEVKKLFQRFKEAEDFLGPVVTARRDAMANADYEKPDDMLQWLIDAQDKSKNGSRNDAELAIWQLGASFTAIHTTTATATNALYTLASMQDIIPVLREEIREALAGSGNEFTNSALQNMVRLESFLTESMRTYPMSAANAQRKVLQPFTLSNGQTIPSGVLIELPSAAVNMDDKLYPSSSQFDAFRFSKLRKNKVKAKEDDTEVGHLFSSVGQTSLNFGFGRHVCPGRFFASVEIKMIVAIILLNFDIMLAEGETERYKNIEIGVQNHVMLTALDFGFLLVKQQVRTCAALLRANGNGTLGT